MKQIFTILILLLQIVSLNAQLYPVSIQEKSDNSSLIVEGTVISQNFLNHPKRGVLTINTIRVSDWIKGESTTDIQVVTRGGTINGETVTWTHLLELKTGDNGVFTLINSKLLKDETIKFYETYSSKQGFIKRISSPEGEYWAEPFHRFYRKNHLHDSFSGEKTLGDNPEDCIIVSLEPVIETNFAFEVKADVKLRVIGEPVGLYQNKFILTYDENVLGSNILNTGVLSYSDGDLLNNTGYTFSLEQLSSNSIKFELTYSGSLSNVSTLNTIKQQLVRLKLNIENFDDLLNSNIQFTVSDEGNHFVELFNSAIKKWDCYDFENNISYFACDIPELLVISPNPAKAGSEIITLIGNNLGDPAPGQNIPDDMHLGFTNAGTSSSDWCFIPKGDIISWNNDEIVVKVPTINEDGTTDTYAGTGPMLIWNDNGTPFDGTDDCVSYSDTLYVTCAKVTRAIHDTLDIYHSIPVKLINQNGTGGYDLYYSSTFKAISGATTAFQTALQTWICATNVHFVIKDSTEISDFTDVCRIDFDNTLPAGVTGTLATTARFFGNCTDQELYPFSVLRKFDMYFNKYVKRTSTGDPEEIAWWTSSMPMPPSMDTFPNIDLETVALHEIGHAIGLLHTNNVGDILYKKHIDTRRELDMNEICADEIVESSLDSATICADPMIKLLCSTSNSNELNPEKGISIYPNPSVDYIILTSIESLDGLINILDITGKRIKSFKVTGNYKKVDISAFPQGTYFVSIVDENITITTKIIKL